MAALLAYLFYFVAASASPLQRRWLANKNAGVSNTGQIHLAFLVSLIMACGGFFLVFLQPFHLGGDPLTLVLLALITAVFGGGYFIPNYIAQKHVEAGVSTLVMNIYTPVAIVLSSLLLNEKLTALQTGGTLLLLVGMVVVSKKHQIQRFKFDSYFLLMLLSGAILGVSLVSERALQHEAGFTAGTLISWWSQCLFLGIAVLFTRAKNAYRPTDVAITGVLRYFQSLSWVILLFVIGNLSLVSAVTTFKVVVIFIAGALFLGERSDLTRKIVGSLIAVVGLLLMK